MIVKILTHMHMVVYTWWCCHIYKGDEVRVDVDQLSDGMEVRKVRNSTSEVSARRVRIVRRCHRRPVQKRQGFTEWTGRWPQLDRHVRSVQAVKTLASVSDQTLDHLVTRHWKVAFGQADVAAQREGAV